MAFFRNQHHDIDPLWHVQLALLATVMLQLLVPAHRDLIATYLLPALELICLLGLQLTTPKTAVFTSKMRRTIAIILIGAVVLVNISSLQELLRLIFTATSHDAGRLLSSAAVVYVTNVVIFGLLFWEMDGGGPGQRRGKEVDADFLFPQQTKRTRWHPTFVDYLYVSVTNATAFSPTDTLPLSRRAKLAMGLQAFVSLVVVALVAARAVNIL